MSNTAAVLTISDKGFAGLREDTSGPALCRILQEQGMEILHTAVLPDEQDKIEQELIRCADELSPALILTTGGTGFSPRDVTPEATLAVIQRQTPGIPEVMRAESMKLTTRGCLSRSVAGIRGKSLIVNLPGSEKAARENLLAVLDALTHGLEMLASSGSADCASQETKPPVPSLDQWLREAKQAPNARQCGMYLFHNGVVRATARACVRDGDRNAGPVSAMAFSHDPVRAKAAVEAAKKLPGIFYARAWLNQGTLQIGEDLMLVLVGGDTRPHVTEALQSLVEELKTQCVTEQEL